MLEAVLFRKTQLKWLKNNLLKSKSTFKVLVFSNQVVNPLTNHETINKSKYRHEKDELFNYIHQQKINGVLIFSEIVILLKFKKKKKKTTATRCLTLHHLLYLALGIIFFFIKEKKITKQE